MTTTAPAGPPAPAPVPVLLDLRRYHAVPASADGYIELWGRLEPTVVSVDPRLGPRLSLDLGPEGEVGIWFLAPHSAPRPMTAATPFAVRGILEPPQIRYPCDTCRDSGTLAYAPFSCPGCGTGERPGRVCDTHAVFLDGSLRASCDRHTPQCRCGARARAWCGGPRCRSGRAWCADHLVRHPNDASVAYCQDCYGERFPDCEHSGCRSTGHVRCEHRSLDALLRGARPGGQTARGTAGPGDHACGRRMCAEHAVRWQIYGARSRGLALCARHHQDLRAATPETLVGLILAGTAARAQAHARSRTRPGGGDAARRQAFLPRLAIVRHIFINTRRTVLDMGALDTLFAGLEQRLRRADGPAAETALRLLRQHEPSRRDDVRRFHEGHEEGRAHFARLVALLNSTGKRELAEGIAFSDYRSKSRILYVKVPAELRGRFYGTRHAHVDDLKQRLGIDIQLERD
ncbi:hypothetical protein ACGFZP_33850 [Kitasatospora sp. NPDC048239]|uniref:hypothetical protein n=1 Tax=Kitasatospora sp. NPDC048239 TaxID=3364046 RepID=UPI0037112DA8